MKLLNSLILFLLTVNYALAVPTKTNPDISLNILLLGQKSFQDKPSEKESHKGSAHSHEGHQHQSTDGVSVQEVELYFKSNIDPYWTGNISLGLAQHGSHFDLDLETAYIDSLFIPNFTLRAGKFYTFFGRHNDLHSHYYPFIDPPLINQKLFGFHGLNGVGASIAYLSPLPWYSEAVIQTIKEEHYRGILFLKNLWDLTDQSTLELDLTYARTIKELSKPNSFSLVSINNITNYINQIDLWKDLYNLSLTWKWQDGNNINSAVWTTELVYSNGKLSKQSTKPPRGLALKNLKPTKNAASLNSYIQFQLLKNWWLQGRAEVILDSKWKQIELQKYSTLLAWTATEYSAVRLQYDMIKINADWSYAIALQTNMSLGAHPAHLY
ncbi:MAG: hypothetical protein OXJ52_00355 [Oligoflexia bacterium]|nr:hypothetical protein [Oligoflexia bacterium]